VGEYIPPNFGIDFQAPGPPPSVTPVQSAYGRSYSLIDDPDNDPHDTGDIPLLRRDNSNTSAIAMPMPGGYDEVTPDNRSETNIRYGRIPQRVPRRYKTIKKVE